MYVDLFQEAVQDFAMRNETQLGQETLDELALAEICRLRAAWKRYQNNSANPARIGLPVGLLCLDDGQCSRELANTPITWFYRELLKHTAPVLARLHADYEYHKKMGAQKLLVEKTVNLTIRETLRMVVAGDLAHCRKKSKPAVARGWITCSALSAPADANQKRHRNPCARLSFT